MNEDIEARDYAIVQLVRANMILARQAEEAAEIIRALSVHVVNLRNQLQIREVA